jgi:5-methylcytosine-specific restriction endonuclease McrA
MPCCGKQHVSEKLKGRTFSDETLKKMIIAANLRPQRGGKERRWRETHMYRLWRWKALIKFNYECAITGAKQDLVVHHLISAHLSESLCYHPQNCVVFFVELHLKFHKEFGYSNNTVSHFIEFLNNLLNTQKSSLPISSQPQPEGCVGSETRVYDPDRVKKLHERLVEVDKELSNF